MSEPQIPQTPVSEPPAYVVPDGPGPIFDGPPSRGRQRLLLIIAAALGSFIVLVTAALALALLLSPALRNRIPLLASDVPPEGPDKFAGQSVGRVQISDDFSAPNQQWDRSQTRVVDGAYELSLELDNFDSYGLFLGAPDVRDFDLAVDATLAAGSPTSEYGIRFRQSAPDDHLMFSVSGSGYYRLVRVQDERYSSLVPWTRDSRISRGVGATNQLRIVADGESITGYINGEQVLEYRDQAQTPGQLTLGVTTFFEGNLTVRFDNVAGFAMAEAPLGDVQPQRVDLAEDFSDPAAARWSVGGATVTEGVYELFVGGAVQSWQQPLPTGASRVEGNFVLEVDATLIDGGDESAYGLMFGDGGRFDFFCLYLLPQGGITMVRNTPAGGEVVIQPTQLPMIKQGLDQTNRIRIEVTDRTLALTINDEPLPPLEFVEGISFDGRAGVVMLSQNPAGVRVRFDNFRLEETE